MTQKGGNQCDFHCRSAWPRLVVASAATRPGSDAFSGHGHATTTASSRAPNGGAMISRSAIRTGTATASCRATKSRAGARRQSNWSQDWNRDGRVDNLDSADRAAVSRLRHERRQPRGAQRMARRRRAVHAARHATATATSRCRNTRRAAGFALDSQGGPCVPLLEHRPEQRRLGHPQRMEHGQHRLQRASTSTATIASAASSSKTTRPRYNDYSIFAGAVQFLRHEPGRLADASRIAA